MKILIRDIMLAMFSRKFLQVYQFLSMSKNYLPQGTLKILYNSLIETHFRYGNIIWENCEETFLTRRQKLQNRAARIITGSDYNTPTEPLIEQLGWKTVRELVQISEQHGPYIPQRSLHMFIPISLTGFMRL